MSSPRLTRKRAIIGQSTGKGVKIKTKSASKKRFSITGTGKLKVTQSGKRHNMIKRSRRQIRNQRGTVCLENGMAKMILRFHNLTK